MLKIPAFHISEQFPPDLSPVNDSEITEENGEIFVLSNLMGPSRDLKHAPVSF